MRSVGFKTLLPFFDKISLILPTNLLPRVVETDPVLAQPLLAMGLLENRDSADVLDAAASAAIVETILSASRHEAYYDRVDWTDMMVGNPHVLMITVEHFGRSAHTQDALKELQSRGLAGSLGDDGLFRMDADLRMFLLAVCAQTMCEVDRGRGRDAVPFRPPRDRTTPWGDDPLRSASTVVARGVEAVGADLSNLPLDEVLGFRKQHERAYRVYMRNLRSFALSLPDDPRSPEWHRAHQDRLEEIRDGAATLRGNVRAAGLKQSLVVGLGLGGMTYNAVPGIYIAATLAAAGAAVGLVGSRPKAASDYNYLFGLVAAQR